jgi:WD40 repeat protein
MLTSCRVEATMLLLEGHSRPIVALAYTPNGQTLVSAQSDGAARRWDPLAGREQGEVGGPIAGGFPVLSADGSTLARGINRSGFVGGTSYHVVVWDVAVDRRLGDFQFRGSDYVEDGPLALSGDGRWLAVGRGPHVMVWDVTTKESRELRGAQDHLRCLSLSPNGRTVVAGGTNYVNVFRPSSSPPLRLHWPTGTFGAVRFIDNETFAAARGDDIGLWDFSAARRRQTLRGHREPVRCLALSPDGRTLASGGDDWSVRLWDVASGRQMASLAWRIGEITAIAFAPDGMTAAAGSERGSILIWDTDTLDR